MATRKSTRKQQQPERPAGPYHVSVYELVEGCGYELMMERGVEVLYAIECDEPGIDCNYSMCETWTEAQGDVDELNRQWAAAH